MQYPTSAELSFRREVAQRLDRARRLRKWSIRELAWRAGVRRQELGKYLSGKRRMTFRMLFALAEALQLQVEVDLVSE